MHVVRVCVCVCVCVFKTENFQETLFPQLPVLLFSDVFIIYISDFLKKASGYP